MKSNMKTLFIIGLLLVSTPALALSLGQAKSQGLVAETPSGYIEARASTNAVKDLVNSVNAKRKARYREISKRNGTPLGTVEKVAGRKLMNR
uniref:DUF1318 domain-containing protein n=1 Tax=Candidatus Kentrum sp. FM TaxID=2126340 RepID=A0A450WDN2_9GAMM|nr:MAG: hypothetical protein BECKFM1743A_GA0114220_102024 [Candidatus Kentron sp. FM]VFJ63336.1 MAG: hypothetical protein BECKFM1743C_GA0114222_103421 [Candidatus Kentron sp. FM]VFK15071.1 MAG: hypothetical protein BECKFM1743B_GA0114221_103521 [Candidatus Kentron sp. FM]